MGVEPELSTVRTWRNDFVPAAFGVVDLEVLGERNVCVDLVCFRVELSVGARALLPLLTDKRGMRD